MNRPKWILLVAFLLAPVAASASPEIDVYLEYEKVYFSNDAKAAKKWIARDARLVQTLHAPGHEPDSVPIARSQLLAAMRRSGPRPGGLLTPEGEVSIDRIDDERFCGTGGAKSEATVAGKQYVETEVRRFCFRFDGKRHVLYEKTIDVYFELIESPN